MGNWPFRGSPVSAEHFKAFGYIVQVFVHIEGVYANIIGHLLQVPEGMFLILFSQHSYDSLKNLMRVCIDHAALSEADYREIEKLLDAVQKKSNLRNNVAHNLWIKGRKPKSIKPLVIKAKGGLLIKGVDHNEKEWTAVELRAEADETLRLGHLVGEFFRKRGVPLGNAKRPKKTKNVAASGR